MDLDALSHIRTPEAIKRASDWDLGGPQNTHSKIEFAKASAILGVRETQQKMFPNFFREKVKASILV